MFSVKKLEELIKKNELTPIELSNKTRINQVTLSRLLSGNLTNPDPTILSSLANFFKTSPYYFIENFDKRNLN